MREQKAEGLVRYTKSALEKDGLSRDERVSYDLEAGTVASMTMTVAAQRA